MGMLSPQIEKEYRLHFDQLEERSGAGQPVWLREARAAAMQEFLARGFPTTREENWRFTNLRELAERPFRLAEPGTGEATAQGLSRLFFADLGCPRFVLVNGFPAPELSELEAMPEGVEVLSLREALREAPDRLRPYLAKRIEVGGNPLDALNTAFIEDGVFLRIAKGADLTTPVHLLHLSVGEGWVAHPRFLIVAEPGSRGAVIESYHSLEAGEHFLNPVTELIVEANAEIGYYKFQRPGADGFHIGTLWAEVERDARLRQHTTVLGGRLVRNHLRAVFRGAGADAQLPGLYLVNQDEFVDHFTILEHAAPNTTSREVYKGVLDGNGRAVFHGRIIVQPGAQNIDAKQTNNNLLLSPGARVNTKPQLEIYADQVKCTHGATVGQLDAESLFYLRSRGIPEEAARSLLTYAFLGESVQAIRVPQLRRRVEEYLIQWLPSGELVREALADDLGE